MLFLCFLEVQLMFIQALRFSFQLFLFVYLSFCSAILLLHFRNLLTEFNLQFISILLQALYPSLLFLSTILESLTSSKELLFVQIMPKQMLLPA
jgi:hypothetical protein